MLQLLRKTVWKFLNKLNTEVPNDPTIPLLDRDLKELKSDVQKHIH